MQGNKSCTKGVDCQVKPGCQWCSLASCCTLPVNRGEPSTARSWCARMKQNLGRWALWLKILTGRRTKLTALGLIGEAASLNLAARTSLLVSQCQNRARRRFFLSATWRFPAKICTAHAHFAVSLLNSCSATSVWQKQVCM